MERDEYNGAIRLFFEKTAVSGVEAINASYRLSAKFTSSPNEAVIS